MEPPEEKQARAAATKTISFLEETRRSYIEEHGQIGRWIMGSLLILNSGAAISLLNNTEIPPIAAVITGSLFCLGIYFALEIGLSTRKALASGLTDIQLFIAYYTSVEKNGKRNPSVEEQLREGSQVDGFHSKKTAISTGLSTICFFLGILGLGSTLIINKYWTSNINIASNQALTNRSPQ